MPRMLGAWMKLHIWAFSNMQQQRGIPCCSIPYGSVEVAGNSGCKVNTAYTLPFATHQTHTSNARRQDRISHGSHRGLRQRRVLCVCRMLHSTSLTQRTRKCLLISGQGGKSLCSCWHVPYWPAVPVQPPHLGVGEPRFGTLLTVFTANRLPVDTSMPSRTTPKLPAPMTRPR